MLNNRNYNLKIIINKFISIVFLTRRGNFQIVMKIVLNTDVNNSIIIISTFFLTRLPVCMIMLLISHNVCKKLFTYNVQYDFYLFLDK